MSTCSEVPFLVDIIMVTLRILFTPAYYIPIFFCFDKNLSNNIIIHLVSTQIV